MPAYCAMRSLGKRISGTWSRDRQRTFWFAVQAGFHPGTASSSARHPKDFYIVECFDKNTPA